jgi:hypothetical protein
MRRAVLLSAVALAVLSGAAGAEPMHLRGEQAARVRLDVLTVAPNLELAQTGVDKSRGAPVPPAAGKPGGKGHPWQAATIPMGEQCSDDLQPPVPEGMQVVRKHGRTVSGKRVHRNELRIDQLGPAAKICLVADGGAAESIMVPFKYGTMDEPAVAD